MGLTSKLQLMNKYKKSLHVLVARFEKTTNQKHGKDAFCEDVLQICSDMKVIIRHGWIGCEQIMRFPRFDE